MHQIESPMHWQQYLTMSNAMEWILIPISSDHNHINAHNERCKICDGFMETISGWNANCNAIRFSKTITFAFLCCSVHYTRSTRKRSNKIYLKNISNRLLKFIEHAVRLYILYNEISFLLQPRLTSTASELSTILAESTREPFSSK